MEHNLVPEPPVTKLGHTGVMLGQKAPMKAPSPSVGVESPRSELTDHIRASVSLEGLFERFARNSIDYEAVNSKIAGFKTSTLLATSNMIDWTLQHNPDATFSHVARYILDYDENIFGALMVCRPLFEPDHNINHDDAMYMIRGLRHLDYFQTREDLTTLSGQELAVTKAFLNVTACVEYFDPKRPVYMRDSDGNGSTHLGDKNLQDLIVSHPDKTHAMMHFISERKAWDATVLRSYIETTSALREGAL